MSDCHSYLSDEGQDKKKERGVVFVSKDKNYVQLTEKTIATFSIGNGILSSDLRCIKFITANPVSNAFLKREKGKLPYSVFKATSNDIRFVKSLFKGRAPTVFFTYPTYVTKVIKFDPNLVKLYNRRGDNIEPLFMAFSISDRTHVYNAVVNTMKSNGFELIENGQNFNLVWTGYT
jgi:hypothetical protein